MKKILNLLTVITLGFLILVPFGRALAITPEPKPADFTNGCLLWDGVRELSEGGTPTAGQFFTANTNRITGITVHMQYSSINSIQLHLYKVGISQEIEGSPVFQVTNESGYVPGDRYSHKWTLNQGLTPGQEYLIIMRAKSGTAGWRYYDVASTCDATGYSGENQEADMTYMIQGYNYVAPAAQNTTAKTTTTPTITVAPSVLAVPKNFRLDRDLNTEIIFAWDKNTEAELTGYVMYVNDGETLVETIDIPGKDMDNYNIVLADHPLLVKDKEYSVKLSAKTATAVSEKTEGLKVTFKDKAAETPVVVQDSKFVWLTNPYVLGGLGFLLLILIGLLVFLERKFHGLGKLFKRKAKE